MRRSDAALAMAAAFGGSWLGEELWFALRAPTWSSPTQWLSIWAVSTIAVAAVFLVTRRPRPFATALAYLVLAVVLTSADRIHIIYGPLAFGWLTSVFAVVVAAVGGRYLATRTGPVRPRTWWARIPLAVAGFVGGAALGLFAGASIADIVLSVAPCNSFECGFGPAVGGMMYGGFTGAIAGIVLLLQATRTGIRSGPPPSATAI